MANNFVFTDEEIRVDEGLGYPKAYAKLCRDRSFGPFSHGPPFTFTPYALVQQEDSRAKELDEMFPVVDPRAKPTTKPKIFLSLLWKQLNHLGNAGFDPEIIRVDQFGNVLYYHADADSPLAWDIDHWFPCSRGGLTVPSNIRILQWQVCKRKHNKLEFLIPWWDFQLGISINQFLSIFASSNSDFRHRAFSWLFSEGESEELNASQTVDSHVFPQHYLESKDKLGLAPAAVVLSRRESFDAPLKSLDVNRRPRSSTPIVAANKTKQFLNEKENAIMASNPYQAIVMARDSLKRRDQTAKMQAEIQKLDNEASELEQRTEDEKVSIQELELVLVKKRRRAEKCRRLAESQSSYRIMLEKMIRDAMHQSVVYKEQVRLNQAAASALLARLEAQKAICDSAERELHKKYKQRDELEKQIRPEWEQARKRSRVEDNTLVCLPADQPETQQEVEISNNAESGKKAIMCLTEHKELRKFLEEDQSPKTANSEGDEEKETGTTVTTMKPNADDNANDDDNDDNGYVVEERLEKLEIQDGGKIYNFQFPSPHDLEEEEEEDEESRRQRGKGNVEKWLQFLLENNDTIGEPGLNSQKITGENCTTTGRTHELIKKLNLIYPHQDIKLLKAQECTETVEMDKSDIKSNTPLINNPPYRIVTEKKKANESVTVDDENVITKDKNEKGLLRSESARGFRRIPSSPSLLLEGMKKRMRKKSLVIDDDNEDYGARSSFIKSSIKTLKRAVRI